MKKFNSDDLMVKIVVLTLLFGSSYLLSYIIYERPAQQIEYGGTFSQVNRCKKRGVKKVKKVQELINEKLNEIDSVYIYTNNFDDKNTTITISANREYLSKNDNINYLGNQQSIFNDCKQINNYLDEYLKNYIFLGFNLLYKNNTNKMSFKLKNLNNIETKTNYKTTSKYEVIQFFKYNDKQKDLLSKSINNSEYLDFKTKKKEISKLDSIKCKKITFTEEELINQKIEIKSELFSFSRPKLSSNKNSTYFFYCYNKKVSKDTFKEKIKLFESLFINKERKDLEGKIKAFKPFNNIKLDSSQIN